MELETKGEVRFDATLSIQDTSRLGWHKRIAAKILPIVAAAYVGGMIRDYAGEVRFFVYALFAVLFLKLVKRNARPRVRARIKATDEGLEIDGSRIAKRDIASGHFQPGVPAVVRLLDRSERVLLDAAVTGEAQGRALLAAVDLDPRHKRAEFKAGSLLYATRARILLFLAVATLALVGGTSAFTNGGPFAPLMFLPFALAMGLGAWPSKLTVGADGVLLQWLGTKRFFPIAQIAKAAEAGPTSIRLTLTSGEEVTLPIGVPTPRHFFSEKDLVTENLKIILARIQETLDLRDGVGNAQPLASLVARGKRSAKDWLDALRKLKADHGAYRDIAVRDDALLQILEDPSAPEDARAGAAFLLRDSLDDEQKTRVRVAADASASPRLRVALDAVTKDDAAATEAMTDFASERLLAVREP